MKIVAGDIGGTKVLLQLVDASQAGRTVLAEQRYESNAYATFDAMLAEFINQYVPAPIDAACFAVAGPVFADRAEVTNLTWKIDALALAKQFAIGRVSLINDFYAVALGVPILAPADFIVLNAGTRVNFAPIAILGAGTGLGEANLVHDGMKWNVVPSEGGHADFAPQDEEQARLFLNLHAKHGHVSWERLLSGMGLVNIHNFLSGNDRAYDETLPMEIAKAFAAGDPIAMRTFAIFVDIYGAEAGNMALRLLARGGVYLAGGVAAKNVDRFTDGRFMNAFLRKGRFQNILAAIPVNLITNPKVGLLGAAEMAMRVASGQWSVVREKSD
ncbi:MAG TPA: glucokinase [Thermoanaerobaculia bacterium]|jgi:glucokinase|nr:glucokinase [Thermoanaerobaculia bacterium]